MAVGERGISRESYPQAEVTGGINCRLGGERNSPSLFFFSLSFSLSLLPGSAIRGATLSPGPDRALVFSAC